MPLSIPFDFTDSPVSIRLVARVPGVPLASPETVAITITDVYVKITSVPHLSSSSTALLQLDLYSSIDSSPSGVSISYAGSTVTITLKKVTQESWPQISSNLPKVALINRREQSLRDADQRRAALYDAEKKAKAAKAKEAMEEHWNIEKKQKETIQKLQNAERVIAVEELQSWAKQGEKKKLVQNEEKTEKRDKQTPKEKSIANENSSNTSNNVRSKPLPRPVPSAPVRSFASVKTSFTPTSAPSIHLPARENSHQQVQLPSEIGRSKEDQEKSPAAMKEKGDAFYKSGDLDSSLAAYQRAIQCIEPQREIKREFTRQELELLSKCYSNISAIHFRLSQRVSDSALGKARQQMRATRVNAREALQWIQVAKAKESPESREWRAWLPLECKAALRAATAESWIGDWPTAIQLYQQLNGLKQFAAEIPGVNFESFPLFIEELGKLDAAKRAGDQAKFQSAAEAKMAEKLFDESEQLFSKALLIDPASVASLVGRARCLLARGDFEGSAADCSLALSIVEDEKLHDALSKPILVSLHSTRAVARAHLSDYFGGLADSARALALAPGSDRVVKLDRAMKYYHGLSELIRRGKEAFNADKLKAANEFYSQAIQFCGSQFSEAGRNAVDTWCLSQLLSERAAVNLKAQAFQATIEDANKALAVLDGQIERLKEEEGTAQETNGSLSDFRHIRFSESNYRQWQARTLSRKGSATAAIGKFDEAIAMFRECSTLIDDENVKNELEEDIKRIETVKIMAEKEMTKQKATAK